MLRDPVQFAAIRAELSTEMATPDTVDTEDDDEPPPRVCECHPPVVAADTCELSSARQGACACHVLVRRRPMSNASRPLTAQAGNGEVGW